MTQASAAAVAIAGTNIALVKYWGKRDAVLNLPRTGSLSLTLAGLETRTSVVLDASLTADRFELDGHHQQGIPLGRVAHFMDLVRDLAGASTYARISSRNSYPTAAGLASSASGFAALALAATTAYGLRLAPEELSALARRGSGSAARSVVGGFAEMSAGDRDDGTDAYARSLIPPSAWDVRMVVAITTEAGKDVGSRAGMDLTAATSPLYQAWLRSHDHDMAVGRAALMAQDLAALGEVMERNCFGMHATMIAARPPLLYWNEATVGAIRAVWRLRDRGVSAWLTIDAGPHVKVLCRTVDAPAVRSAISQVPGVLRVMIAAPGEGVRLENGG